MRSIVYTKPGLELVEVPEPQIARSDDVKIRVAYSSLCGTDLHILRGDFDAVLGDEPTFAMGHEASGYVVEVGEGATAKGLAPGDKVTFYFNRYCGSCHYCRVGREQFCTAVISTMGFMSDFVVLSEQQVFPLPADADLAAASLIEPVSVVVHGTDLITIRSGSTVAISGGGGIGQIAARLAARLGAASVTLLEPVADKRALAAASGVDRVVDPLTEDLDAVVQEMTEGRGFDVVIETSGATSACATCFRIAGKGATVEYLATYSPDFEFPIRMVDAFYKELTIISGVYQSPYALPRAAALHRKLHVEDLVTVFTPEDFQAGFDAQANGRSIKTVFQFSE